MKNKLVEALVISSGCMVGGGIVYGIAFYLERHNPPLWLLLVAVFVFLTTVIYLIIKR